MKSRFGTSKRLQIGSRNWGDREILSKIAVLDYPMETTFCSSYPMVREIECSIKRDSTVVLSCWLNALSSVESPQGIIFLTK